MISVLAIYLWVVVISFGFVSLQIYHVHIERCQAKHVCGNFIPWEGTTQLNHWTEWIFTTSD